MIMKIISFFSMVSVMDAPQLPHPAFNALYIPLFAQLSLFASLPFFNSLTFPFSSPPLLRLPPNFFSRFFFGDGGIRE